jgi:hypothetical protein
MTNQVTIPKMSDELSPKSAVMSSRRERKRGVETLLQAMKSKKTRTRRKRQKKRKTQCLTCTEAGTWTSMSRSP